MSFLAAVIIAIVLVGGIMTWGDGGFRWFTDRWNRK